MKRFLAVLVSSIVLATSASASAVEFVPTNDPVGFVSGSAGNNGFNLDGLGRGIIFDVDVTQSVESAGIYVDMTNVALTYQLFEVPDASSVAGRTLLTSETKTTSTNGFEWVDFSFSSLSLLSGKSYFLAFFHEGNSNKQFFYNNDNVRWSQDGLSNIDGTAGASVSNFVVSSIRLNADVTPVPLPAGAPLLLAGFALLAGMRRFRKAAA